MKWNISLKRKHIYEALGCISDKRIELNLVDGAKVYSSSGGKFYAVKYDSKSNSVMSNDNTSYWTGQLGYPSIALLLLKGIISYDPRLADFLKGIKWKDINQKFKNDYDKTEEYVGNLLKEKELPFDELNKDVDRIKNQLVKLELNYFGEKTKPPIGY